MDAQLLGLQYDGLLSCCRDLLAILDEEDARDRAAKLGRCRLRLSGLLHRNLLDEDEQMISPIRQRALAAVLPNFEEVSASTNELRSAYSEHVRRWSLKSVSDNPSLYAVDVRKLTETLSALLRRKKEMLPSAARLLGAAPHPATSKNTSELRAQTKPRAGDLLR